MKNKKKIRVNELDILSQMNDMNTMEFRAFRKENEKYDDMIAKRVVRNPISRFIKRCIDILAGIVGVLLLVPIICLVYIMRIVYKENDGPIFYKQQRIGKNGSVFYIHKFRSMIVDADKVLGDYLASNPEAAREYELNHKLENDPRITKIGKFLRKASLDEWPQFIEILTGKMSLVGPRPYLLSEKEEMGDHYQYIIRVKPGLTGPWQIAGRSDLVFEDRLKLDEEYASRCGNHRDIIIIFKTFKTVFSRKGAI